MPRSNVLSRYLEGNSYNRFPSIESGNTGFTPLVFNPNIQFTPSQDDASILERSLGKMEERKNRANAAKTAVQAAISNFELNEADDEFKRNYINDVTSTLDVAAQTGDYSLALDIGTQFARKVADDPELNLRARTNAEYKDWVENIENLEKAGKIDTVTKDRLLDENKYNFVGNRDENGNLVSAKKWSDIGGKYGSKVESPVQKVSLDALLLATNQFVAEKSGSYESMTAVDEEGKKVELYDQNSAILKKSGGSYARKNYSDLKAVFDEMQKRHPEAIAYLSQQYRDSDWQIKNLEAKKQEALNNNDEGTAIALDGQIKALKQDIMPNGIRLSLPEYLKRQSDETLKRMAYNRTTSNISIASGAKTKTSSPDGSPLDVEHSHPDAKGSTVQTPDNNTLSAKVNTAAESVIGFIDSLIK